ncbi:MAG TPA: RimK family alpha-L-glutamate ligase [Gaiellaceae bacterium]|nr:RimK family alpha-L-glutamate ligase [Gaiellaceae bacterium]
MRFAIVAHRAGETNIGLITRGWSLFEPVLQTPREAMLALQPGDAALGRLDIREGLDGIEDGLWALSELSASGVSVLNPPAVLISAHDKLVTARALRRAGLPHPETRPLTAWDEPVDCGSFPLVVKPRFGSWGRDVMLCRNRNELELSLEHLSRRSWFRSHGGLVQELIPPLGHDLRLIVADGCVVGAIKRVARVGEWRTNVALGATREPVVPPPIACELAVAAATAIGGDLVGVDLLPLGPGRYVVLEINAAVDFTSEYSVDQDVFDRVADALVRRVATSPSSLPPPEPAAAAA